MFFSIKIPIAQVKDENTSQKLFNKIKQILYPMYRSSNVTIKVCQSI